MHEPEVRHRVSSRARRLTLRVSPEGCIACTRPRGAPLRDAQAFVASRQGWIEARLAALPRLVVVGPGASLPVEGRAREIVVAAGGQPRLEGDRLVLPVGGASPGVAAAAWLRTLARARLEAACRDLASALSRRHGCITLRDTRSRWGSCTARGDLMFSWRLAMAPPEVLRYVAAHEVAHLARMDHSPAFWALVERLVPGWRPHRAWLRTHGPGLMRYRFDPPGQPPSSP